MTQTHRNQNQQGITDQMVPTTSLRRPEKYGIVYTKPWVVELVLDLAGYLPEACAVEPVAWLAPASVRVA